MNLCFENVQDELFIFNFYFCHLTSIWAYPITYSIIAIYGQFHYSFLSFLELPPPQLSIMLFASDQKSNFNSWI